MKVINNTLRSWLVENDYEDVALIIDEILDEWKKDENGTRRNWWDKLAGGKNGVPLKVAGKEIPVLRAAQIRQGKPITKNAICRNENEIIPRINN
jgi:uncharacterized protein (UPF0248 family)